MNMKMNRRKYFRVQFTEPLSAEMTIILINEKAVKINSTMINIYDIGMGGLLFTSELSVPVSEKIIYEFKLTLFDKNMQLNGYIVRKLKKEKDIFSYGVQFVFTNETEQLNVFKTLNALSLSIKRRLLVTSSQEYNNRVVRFFREL